MPTQNLMTSNHEHLIRLVHNRSSQSAILFDILNKNTRRKLFHGRKKKLSFLCPESTYKHKKKNNRL